MTDVLTTKPVVTTRVVLTYSDEVVEISVRLPAYLDNDAMHEVREVLQGLANFVWRRRP
jgi:hypothetical protein